MFKFLLLNTTILCLVNCQNPKRAISNIYPKSIGDIPYDPKLDDPEFMICDSTGFAVQYYAFQKKAFDGEKKAIETHFKKYYDTSDIAKESGWIRIRFVVNCKGESGRFRCMGAGKDYKAKVFDKSITEQLMQITKDLKGWKIMKNNDKTYDYYQYLLFKLDNGKIQEILP